MLVRSPAEPVESAATIGLGSALRSISSFCARSRTAPMGLSSFLMSSISEAFARSSTFASGLLEERMR